MKQKINFIPKLIGSLVFLILISCSEDLYENHQKLDFTNQSKISLSQFKKETGTKKFDTYLEVPITQNNINGRTASLSDFIIDTLAVIKYINENNKTTYTFRIYSVSFIPEENEKFNLVYRKENNIWEKAIFSFKENILATLPNQKFIDYDRLYESNSTQRMIRFCYDTVQVSQCIGCAGECDAGHCPTGACYSYTVTTISECGGIGAPTPNTEIPSDTGGGTGSDYDIPHDVEDENQVLPTTPDSPCEDLADVCNPNIGDLKSEIDWLKTKVTESIEYGVAVEKKLNFDGVTYNYPKNRIISTEQYSVELPTAKSYVGSAHSHPINSYAIPSFGDIKWLLSCYEGASNTRKGYVFSIVVCKDVSGIINVYALRIKDILALTAKVNAVWDDPKYSLLNDKDKLDAIHKAQRNKMIQSGNQLEKSFLQQFGDFGIDLYKATNDNLNSWDKLKLSNTVPLIVNHQPCN